MKTICYIFVFFFTLLQVRCKGQEHTSESKSNDGTFQLKFRQYEIDSCLIDVLYSIVDADSSRSRYPSDIYHYSLLLFEQMPTYCTIIIRPDRWQKDLPIGCNEIIEIEGMSFVCCGLTDESSLLFKDMGIDLVKDISTRDTPLYDSLDLEEKFAGWEKSKTALVGTYQGCKPGYSVRFYIDVGKKLLGMGNAK